MREREGAESRVALAFGSGLGNSKRGAFCPVGKEMLHGNLWGGSGGELVLDKVSMRCLKDIQK